jgi:hypothetical protein
MKYLTMAQIEDVGREARGGKINNLNEDFDFCD